MGQSHTGVNTSTLLIGTAHAQAIQIDMPTAQLSEGMSRAEVLAELHLWRLSGLQELNQGEQSVDANSIKYQLAFASYVQLRKSPQFAALVDQIQQQPNARVTAVHRSTTQTQARN